MEDKPDGMGLPETGPGEAQAFPIKAPDFDMQETVPLTSKLGEIRERIESRKKAVLDLGEILDCDAELPEEIEELTEDDVVGQAELLTERGMSDVGGLRRGSQLASRLSDLGHEETRNAEKVRERRYGLLSEKTRLEMELGRLERRTGFRRFATVRSRAGISKRIKGLDFSMEECRNLEREALGKAGEYDDIRSGLRKAQSKAFSKIIEPELRGIMDGYGEFLETILEDGSMLGEIREIYIEKKVVPKLKRLEENGSIQPEDSERFLSQLRADLVGRDEFKDGGSKPFSQELRETAKDFYPHVEYDLVNLMHSYDRRFIEDFVSDLAYDGFSGLHEDIRQLDDSYNWLRYIDYTFSREIFGRRLGVGRGTVREMDAGELHFNRMPVFDVVRESKTVRAVFGKTIERVDNEVYEISMDKALSDNDGGHIEMLAYYPTPEAIRNLLTIASADYQNYRTVHANWVLTRLARREDWGEILDRAVNELPSLDKARNILQEWDYSEYSNHPEVRQAGVGAALAIIDSDEDVDPRLVELAVEALPNDDILSMLVKDGVLTAEDVMKIRKGVDFLQGFVETSEEKKERLSKEPGEVMEDDLIRSGFDHQLWQFEQMVRNTALEIRHVAGDKGKEERLSELLVRLRRFERIGEEWQKYGENMEMLDYLSSYTFLDMAANVSDDRAELLFAATDYCPVLTTARGRIFLGAIKENTEEFLNEDGLRFLQRFSDSYSDYSEYDKGTILKLTSLGKISRERTELLPTQAKDLLEKEHFSIVTQFPELYLASDDGAVFYRKMCGVYKEKKQLGEFSVAIVQRGMPKELALAFPEKAPQLMDLDRQSTLNYVLQNAKLIAQNEGDLKFLNSFVGMHGKAADQLVRDYTACVNAGSVSAENRGLVIDFTRRFRVLSPGLFDGYKDADKNGTTEVYLSGLQNMAERMASSTPLTDRERETPYYKDLLRAVYQNNSGNWTSYENNETCSDRSEDLAQFEIRSRYEIDLMSASEIRLKESEVLDEGSVDKLKSEILSIYQEMGEYGYDSERAQENLAVEVDEALAEVREFEGLSEIDFDKIQTVEEKMFLLMVDQVYGSKNVSEDTLKRLLIKYQFAYFDDIRQYIQGTSDRVSRANNQDYALLCELHGFYSDRIKEVNRGLVRAGWDNSAIAEAMPHYFNQLAERLSSTRQQDQLNRLRVDRLGLSDSFIQQVGRTLSGKTGKRYTPEQVRKLIGLYESVAGGLQEDRTDSPKKRTKGLYGQLRAQRAKTIQAMQSITGEVVDPVDIHLGDIDLQDLLSQQRDLEIAEYDSEQFANFTAQRFLELFGEEREALSTELDKFESSTGKGREVLYGYISKTKESAHARMVGGVCVSGDNPGKSGEKCQWNMPNFFQLVLQDPNTLRCQGVALLHHYVDKDGKKILAASLNPSSTYLYSVDETGLMEGMMGALEIFAQDNDFDLILTSKNKTIRTNRTGGEFERAMDKRVRRYDESYVFDEPQQFSYNPQYSIDSMDVVWKKEE